MKFRVPFPKSTVLKNLEMIDGRLLSLNSQLAHFDGIFQDELLKVQIDRDLDVLNLHKIALSLQITACSRTRLEQTERIKLLYAQYALFKNAVVLQEREQARLSSFERRHPAATGKETSPKLLRILKKLRRVVVRTLSAPPQQLSVHSLCVPLKAQRIHHKKFLKEKIRVIVQNIQETRLTITETHTLEQQLLNSLEYHSSEVRTLQQQLLELQTFQDVTTSVESVDLLQLQIEREETQKKITFIMHTRSKLVSRLKNLIKS
jgi:hypothetical protein